MAEVKPIVIVYLPENISDNGMKSGWTLAGELREQFQKEMPEYYWFVLIDYNAERIELKVFYEKDFTEITYDELKKIIEDSIKQK